MATPSLHPVRARLLGAALALGVAVTGAATGAHAAPPGQPSGGASSAALEPVLDQNFADPDVLLVDGVYHAYATNSGGQNVQHATSTDLRTWTVQGDVAPVLGDWVGECSFAPGGATDQCVWAPEVAAVEGGYALYYTARDEASQRQCIGLALAESPDGPFEPVGDDPLVCPVELGGAIDAASYTEDGRLWLLWKADGNCCSSPAIIYLQELSADGTTLLSEPVELIRNDQPWEGAVVEAPTLVRLDGTYYLFYSSNDFGGGNYRTGYATADTITGPYTKSDTELMTTDLFDGEVMGPGGQDVVVQPDGSLGIVFHGWDERFGYRAMYLSDLELSADGVPSVAAAATRYQAEDGTVVAARVVADAAASGGAKVGGMDFADSSITVEVFAEQAGPATLGIRYTNGSLDAEGRPTAATDTLTVNGRDAGVVTLAHTTWGNWQIVEQQVRLQKGWNTITLTRGTYFAEIDAFDLSEADRTPTPSGPPAGDTAVRYEAEEGVVTNARVRPDGGASGGAVVGGLDFADSSVSVEVWADRGGPATLTIRYANGSERGGYGLESRHLVTVDGRDAGTVTYEFTRWGNWQTVDHTVVLHKGWNTVTLTHDLLYAEIDAIDVS